MIGLVNSAGASEASRIQATEKAGSENGNGKPLAPVLTNERAVKRVLDKAVESIEFASPNGQRGLPDGDQSDRFAQADAEQRPTQDVGTALDVTA